MTPYYECHITLEGDPILIKQVVQEYEWKFSRIDGDPVLGAGVKCYATKHFNSSLHKEEEVITELRNAAMEFETLYRIPVIRQKVELVIFDSRGQ